MTNTIHYLRGIQLKNKEEPTTPQLSTVGIQEINPLGYRLDQDYLLSSLEISVTSKVIPNQASFLAVLSKKTLLRRTIVELKIPPTLKGITKVNVKANQKQ